MPACRTEHRVRSSGERASEEIVIVWPWYERTPAPCKQAALRSMEESGMRHAQQPLPLGAPGPYPQPTSHHRCWSDTRIARRTSGVGGRPAPELEVTPGGDDLLAVRCVHHRVDTPGVALPAAHHALGTPVVEQATAVFAAAHDLLRPAAGRYLCITGACTHTHTPPPPPRPVFFTLPAPRSLCCIAGARVMGVCSEACGRQKYTVFSMSSCSCGASCICGAAADAPCAEPPPPVRALRPTPSSTANTTSSGSVPRVLLPQAPMRPVRVGLAPGRPGPRRPQWGSTSHLAYAMADAVRLTISR